MEQLHSGSFCHFTMFKHISLHKGENVFLEFTANIFDIEEPSSNFNSNCKNNITIRVNLS